MDCNQFDTIIKLVAIQNQTCNLLMISEMLQPSTCPAQLSWLQLVRMVDVYAAYQTDTVLKNIYTVIIYL